MRRGGVTAFLVVLLLPASAWAYLIHWNRSLDPSVVEETVLHVRIAKIEEPPLEERVGKGPPDEHVSFEAFRDREAWQYAKVRAALVSEGVLERR